MWIYYTQGEKDGQPVGQIIDKDSVILFNFRGDRALELSMAFDNDDFTAFDRGVRQNVVYAGMLQYDGDLNLPKRYLVNPPEIHDTLSELLVSNGLKQYAVSETQKYGHVTYFWNGKKSEIFSEELETFKEILSDKVSFDERPWMKSAEITADHGNADEMYEKNKKGELQVRTAHSLNHVPFIIYDKNNKYTIKEGKFGLVNVAPTVAQIFLNFPHNSHFPP